MKQNYRAALFRVNKYQKKVLQIPLVIGAVLLILVSFSVVYVYKFLINPTLTSTIYLRAKLIYLSAIGLIFLFWLGFTIMMIWAYALSHKLLGAFERINRELDEVIEKKVKRHVRARKNDELANEILKRVNSIIDELPWEDKGGEGRSREHLIPL